MLRDFADLLANWTPGELQKELGVKYVTARAMQLRGSVSTRYWDRLIAASERKGITVTHAMLTRFHVAGKRRDGRKAEDVAPATADAAN